MLHYLRRYAVMSAGSMCSLREGCCHGVFFQRYSVFYNSIRDLGDICQDCFMSGKNNTVKED